MSNVGRRIPGSWICAAIVIGLSVGASCRPGAQAEQQEALPEPLPAAPLPLSPPETQPEPGPGAELPAVTLARVHAAPQRARTPGVILTVTAQHLHLDATAVLRAPHGEVAPEVRGRERLELQEVLQAGEENGLQARLAPLFALAGLRMEDDARTEVPQMRLRVAAELRFGDLVKVLMPVVRAGYGALEFEVTTGTGVGHLNLRPYTYCACAMPPRPSWCATPELRVERTGVTLTASADLRPPAGCHKAIPRMGESEPAFEAAVDWRDRAIAGPQGGCPSAQVSDSGLDVASLSDRLRALQRAAPGCGWASMAIDDEVPWSIVAPAMAALFAEFGEVRMLFSEADAPSSPRRKRQCLAALPVSALAPASAGSAAPMPPVGRPGCAD